MQADKTPPFIYVASNLGKLSDFVKILSHLQRMKKQNPT
jgi:hypothetical protein